MRYIQIIIPRVLTMFCSGTNYRCLWTGPYASMIFEQDAYIRIHDIQARCILMHPWYLSKMRTYTHPWYLSKIRTSAHIYIWTKIAQLKKKDTDVGRSRSRYQSKTIRQNKNVPYGAHLCPNIVKWQQAPNAKATLRIVKRHYEELKSSWTDSQILNKVF